MPPGRRRKACRSPRISASTCSQVPTAPWPRFGVDGGLVHLKGRGDFVSIFVLDLAPGAKSAPQKHLFEEVVYVLSGHGNTTIETSDGRKHSFEWGPKSLFALPLNARYQHFNSSGRERARLASTNNLALMLNLFHNEAFVFDNAYDFPERQGAAKYFSGEGEFIPVRPGRNMWETNFIPDLAGFELKSLGAARRRRIEHDVHPRRRHHARPHLADAGRHLQEGPPPRRRLPRLRGHRAWLLAAVVRGEKDFVRIDWKHGWVFAPPDQMFHQHFNTAPDPARYLAVAFGSLRYPFTTDKRHVFLGMDVSVKDGGCQIEYEHQDPRIHDIYLAELGKYGVKSGMAKFVDERPYAKSSA